MENVGGSLIQWNFLHLFWQSSQQHHDNFEKGPWSSHYITDLRRGGGFIRHSVTQLISLIGIKLLEVCSPPQPLPTQMYFLVVLWQDADFGLFWVIGMMSMARWRPTRTQEQWWWCLWLQWWWCWRCCWWWWWQDLQVDGWWLSREAVASYSLTSELPFASNYHLLLLSAQWTHSPDCNTKLALTNQRTCTITTAPVTSWVKNECLPFLKAPTCSIHHIHHSPRDVIGNI